MIYMENDDAVFRSKGPSIYFPSEVFNLASKKFEPYEGSVPKPADWGEEMSKADAKQFVESVGGVWDDDDSEESAGLEDGKAAQSASPDLSKK